MLFSLSMIDWLFFKTRVAPNSLSNERFLMFRIARRKQYILSLLPFNLEFFFVTWAVFYIWSVLRTPMQGVKHTLKAVCVIRFEGFWIESKAFILIKSCGWVRLTYLWYVPPQTTNFLTSPLRTVVLLIYVVSERMSMNLGSWKYLWSKKLMALEKEFEFIMKLGRLNGRWCIP